MKQDRTILLTNLFLSNIKRTGMVVYFTHNLSL
jgi:hypothetical protein